MKEEAVFLKGIKKYKVSIEGANLLMDIQGTRRFGYFATRYVDGDDTESASARALELIKAELDATGVLRNDIDSPPIAKVSSIEKMGPFERPKISGKGFTFFPEDQ